MPLEPGFYWVAVSFFAEDESIEVAKWTGWTGHEWELAGSEIPVAANLGKVRVLSSRLEPPVAS